MSTRMGRFAGSAALTLAMAAGVAWVATAQAPLTAPQRAATAGEATSTLLSSHLPPMTLTPVPGRADPGLPLASPPAARVADPGPTRAAAPSALATPTATIPAPATPSPSGFSLATASLTGPASALTPGPTPDRCAQARPVVNLPSPFSTSRAGEAAALEQLAGRLLASSVEGADGASAWQVPPFFPGQVPPQFPAEVPLPPQARLVGSVAAVASTTHSCPTNPVIVVVDAAGAPDDVLAFYARALPTRGWRPALPASPRGGFVPTWAAAQASYCHDASNSWLNVHVQPRPGGPNDVQLVLDTIVSRLGHLCLPPQPSYPIPFGSIATELLPRLDPPQGVVVRQDGGPELLPLGDVTTDLSAVELQAYLAPQVEAAGWTRRAEGVVGPLAWSTWHASTDGAWEGALFVLELPNVPRRSVFLRVAPALPPAQAPTPVPRRQDAPLLSPAAPADEAGRFRNLVERLLSTTSPQAEGQPTEVRLLPGSLPPSWPPDLPLPPHTRVFGTALTTYPGGGAPAEAEVVLATPGSAQEIATFFRDELTRRDWQRAGSLKYWPQGSSYCSPDQHVARGVDLWLRVQVGEQPLWPGEPAGTADVRVTIAPNPDEDYGGPLLCPVPRAAVTTPNASPQPVASPTAVVPALHGPDGQALVRRLLPPERVELTAAVETDLRAVDLLAGYAPQIEAAGWSRSGGGAAGPWAWATWRRLTDREWRAFLLVEERPQARQRTLWLQVVDASPPAAATAVAATAAAVRQATYPPVPPPPTPRTR